MPVDAAAAAAAAARITLTPALERHSSINVARGAHNNGRRCIERRR